MSEDNTSGDFCVVCNDNLSTRCKKCCADTERIAFQRGAEAMREACARMEPYAYNLDDHLMISKWRSLVRGLSIPEDK